VAGHAEGNHTLLGALDNTVSPMGARLLRRWIVFPLRDVHKINERLDTVEFLVKETDFRNRIIHHLRQCGDIERLVSKIPLRKINPREVLQLAKGLKQAEAVKALCSTASNDYLKRLGDALNPCPFIADKIFREIVDNPPAVAAKGNVINSGVNAELDELRTISSNGKEYLVRLQQQEAVNTGISSLKIGFNNVFGYYLEVTHAHKDKVPSAWMRKQTLTNAERYITPELKEYEEKITGAEEKILRIEMELFESLLTELFEYLGPVQSNGNIMAILDGLCCFAHNAIHFQYRKPQMHTGDDLVIREKDTFLPENLISATISN
jgi:DNA mismatch repair protein MutS